MTNEMGLDWKIKATYSEFVDYLLEKYGEVKRHMVPWDYYDRFYNKTRHSYKETTSRTDEGLITHTIHTDIKPLDLPAGSPRRKYQVYCDLLEQLLLRIKIVEANTSVNHEDLYGMGLTAAL